MKLWVLNTIVGIACALVGVFNYVQGDAILGTANTLLAVANIAAAVRGYSKNNW